MVSRRSVCRSCRRLVAADTFCSCSVGCAALKRCWPVCSQEHNISFCDAEQQVMVADACGVQCSSGQRQCDQHKTAAKQHTVGLIIAALPLLHNTCQEPPPAQSSPMTAEHHHRTEHSPCTSGTPVSWAMTAALCTINQGINVCWAHPPATPCSVSRCCCSSSLALRSVGVQLVQHGLRLAGQQVLRAHLEHLVELGAAEVAGASGESQTKAMQAPPNSDQAPDSYSDNPHVLRAVRRQDAHRPRPPDGHTVARPHLPHLIGVPRSGQDV